MTFQRPEGVVFIPTDIERVKLANGVRRLDFSLAEIRELLDWRDRKNAPCGMLLEMLDQKAEEINGRILELQQLEMNLNQLFSLGNTVPKDAIDGRNCVCHLASEHV